MLGVNVRCPTTSSGADRKAFIGLSSNDFFKKSTITVEEAMEFLQNTYILYYDGGDSLYYETLLAYIRQKTSDAEWSVYEVEADSSSFAGNVIHFYGTQDHITTKMCNLSVYKSNGVLLEPFDFVQWSS